MTNDSDHTIQRKRKAGLARRAHAVCGLPERARTRSRKGAVPCPECGETTLVTIDSRHVSAPWGCKRRRACSTCGVRITTYEHVAAIDGAFRDEGAGI